MTIYKGPLKNNASYCITNKGVGLEKKSHVFVTSYLATNSNLVVRISRSLVHACLFYYWKWSKIFSTNLKQSWSSCEGCKSKKIHSHLVCIYDNKTIDIINICWWVVLTKKSESWISDKLHLQRPKTTTNEKILKVRSLILKKWKLKQDEITSLPDISQKMVSNIVKTLSLRKVGARWVLTMNVDGWNKETK